jgi:drug/metabolite transporter (DMT)-like permease
VRGAEATSRRLPNGAAPSVEDVTSAAAHPPVADPTAPVVPTVPAQGTPGRRVSAAALAAMTVTVLAWASAFVGIRGVGRAYEPGPLALGRLLLGTAALGLLLATRRRWVRPTGREWGLLVVCGLAWFAVYNVALNAAERRVDAGTTAMLVNIGPILIALLAGALLGEGFPRPLLVGAAVAFAGAVLIGVATSRSSGADGVGVLLCLLAAATYAIGVVSQKPALRRLPALQVTWTACAIGTVACLPFLPELVRETGRAGAGPIAGLVYLGLVPTALAFTTWAYTLARMDAGRLGVTTYLVPPLAILAAWPLLGEVPPVLAVVGGVVCLAGVALSRRRP